MGHHILSINSGSSSMKFALYSLDSGEELEASGAVERIGLKGGWLWLEDGHGNRLADKHGDYQDHRAAVIGMFSEAMGRYRLPEPDAVGQRIAMGGPDHFGPELITPGLMQTLRKLLPLAPLHIPAEIKGIEAVAGYYPSIRQVACFDTAFHRRMPEIAKWMPLPRSLWHEGIHRYGFHGLSYEYIMSTLGEEGRGRVIVAHLGNGASMAAVRDGMPLDTTMSFSPLGGLMMGTRSGDLDPGVLVYLMEQKGYTARDMDRMFNERSGLLGVSGISPDMKILLENRDANPHAAQAIELFCYIARKYIGALSAVLGGLDLLVFTGGIGEHAAPVRWLICRGLAGFGIVLEPEANDADADVISMMGSRCTVRVIPTDEDLMIARHTGSLLYGNPEGGEA